jgi:hypothetical protein
MNSNTLKRTAATLGVVAGLLAAAGPASAQGGGADFTRFVVDGPITAKAAPHVTVDAGSGDDKVKAAGGRQVSSEALALDDYGPHMARFTLDVASSEVFELNTFGLTEHEGAAVGVRENGSQGARAVLIQKNDTQIVIFDPSLPT